ncbi:MAG TPA: hypothetical protein VF756_11080 [Thermoanaerobaculia bacterium]
MRTSGCRASTEPAAPPGPGITLSLPGVLTAPATRELCYSGGMLNPTPAELMVDQQGRPYFLWDSDMTLEEFRRGLEDNEPEARAYLVGKLMRQAKPDDVFAFVSPREIRELWPLLERYLGKTREFWTWLFGSWEAQGRVWR